MHRWFENQLASAVTWALWRRRGKLEGKALHLHVDAQTRTFGRAVCFWEVTKGLEKTGRGSLADGSFEIQGKLRNECKTLKLFLLRRLWD